MKEAVWLKGLLQELHIPVQGVPLFCDNAGCIQNLRNPINSRLTKHVGEAFHHARCAIANGEVDIIYVTSKDNVADVFTKPLIPIEFSQHRRTLGVVPRTCSKTSPRGSVAE